MPRIRNWKYLKFYRPSRDTRYAHIDDLFCDTPINWTLIATHLPDMLRVALSIKAGRLTASTLLRRLNSYSRKNKLYHAFCELGRVIRTGFLLRFLANEELRTTIHAATNKSEAFNAFVQWVAFGSDGTIRENDRLEQQKLIRYNQLVANCVIFYNVHAVSEVLHELQHEGHMVDEATLAALSPYLRQHIDRFGRYHLDLSRQPLAIDYDRFMLPGTPDAGAPSILVQQPPLWSVA
jgi:TnpA family transposase